MVCAGLLVTCVVVAIPTLGRAEAPAQRETATSNALGQTAIGAQFSIGRLNVGMMAFGFVATYSPRPYYAVGVELGILTVGPGAQSGGCANCLASLRAGALGELRTTWPQNFHLFARLTLGSSVGDWASDRRRRNWLMQIAAGPELLARPMYVRPFVLAGAFGWREIWVGCGAEIGAIF